MEFAHCVAIGLTPKGSLTQENEWSVFLTQGLYDPRLLILIYKLAFPYTPLERYSLTSEELNQIFNCELDDNNKPLWRQYIEFYKEVNPTDQLTFYISRNLIYNKQEDEQYSTRICSPAESNQYGNFVREEIARSNNPILKNFVSSAHFDVKDVLRNYFILVTTQDQGFNCEGFDLGVRGDMLEDRNGLLYYLLRNAYWQKQTPVFNQF